MKLAISIILFVLFISANVEADLNESCQVQGTYSGICVFLMACKYYFNLIHNFESLGLTSQEAFQILREVNCGYIMANALVCCPIYSNSRNQTANSPPNNLGNSQQIGPIFSDIPLKSPKAMTRVPASSVSTSKPTSPMTTTPTATFSVESPTAQLYETQKPIETTTPVAPDTATKDPVSQGIDKEKFNILPKECGRVLTFKYFRGNRTEFDDFPWTTLVEYETPIGKNFGCGGALIHNRYVLTAAHCVTDLPPSWKPSRVRFGEYDTDTDVDCLPDGPDIMVCNKPTVDVAVEQVIVHPGFMSGDPSRLHDIALLRLSAFVKFSDTVKPICLPTKNPFPQKFYTSGWGKDLTKGYLRNGTNLKYMSYVNLVPKITCEKSYTQGGIKISQSHMCGGASLGERSCISDAGGPLMGLEELRNLEKRVVAFGVLSLNKPATGNCQGGYPSVYTKVLDHMDWILNNLRQ